MPPITETFYPHTREAWHLWLSQNHQNKKEIWLLYPHKNTGLPGIAYPDAVQEAICFVPANAGLLVLLLVLGVN